MVARYRPRRGAPEIDRDTPGAGNVVDIVLKDQMWDNFGGLSQLVEVNGTYRKVVYDAVEVTPSAPGKAPPLLRASGRLDGLEGFVVVTAISLDPERPHVV